MKKLLLLFALVSVSAFAQTQDCRVTFTFNNGTGLTSSTPIDNRQAGCDSWVLQYVATNVNPINMTVEQSFATTNCTGAVYVAFSGSITAGANPAVSLTGTETRLAGYAPCTRVTITGTPAGNWIVTGVLYGFRSGYLASSASPGTACPNPCPVVGTAADGAVSSGSPVQSGGVDSAGNARHFSTNTNGVQSMGQLATGADGQANNTDSQLVQGQGATAGPLEVRPQLFNGTTWDRQRSLATFPGVALVAPTTADGITNTVPTACNLSQYSAIVLPAAATTTFITGAAGKTIRICALSGTLAAAGTWKITVGTTGGAANCGTATAVITPPMSLALGQTFAWGSGIGSVFDANTAGVDICITLTGAGATGTFLAQYALR